MNWVSIVIALVIALATWRAYRNGFIRELVGLCALILAVPIAGIFYDDMYPKVHPIVDSDAAANLISFLSILAGVVVGGQVVAYLLREAAQALNLGWADRVAGAAFGLLQAVVLCQVVLIALIAFPRPDIRADVDDSALARALLDGTPLLVAILPRYFDEVVDTFLEGAERLDGEEEIPPTG